MSYAWSFVDLHGSCRGPQPRCGDGPPGAADGETGDETGAPAACSELPGPWDAGYALPKQEPLPGDIYDTTKLGHYNTGHVFGDDLSAGERAAVLEYLETL
ncbi:hypothetical protein [Enhygromyxa salina]|uniref:hypothetical protein n=1 Tax=Enhygromyxa salina TaxID=215803 RepID=UPI0011B201F4|nr:hypothetical protein [Enhygromyxa salina]